MLIRGAEVGPGCAMDLRIAGGSIAEMAPRLSGHKGEHHVEARGCTLLPGLHDHHLHLLALAAARTSLQCGPPQVHDREALAVKLAEACARQPAGVRGIGYSETPPYIDRSWLDALSGDTPVRIQHRSGRLWILNSAAMARLRSIPEWPQGAERDARGQPTGRFFHLDAWLREHLPSMLPPLAPVSLELARLGVTGVTDAGPDNDDAVLALLAAAQAGGDLRQRVRLMGKACLSLHTAPWLTTGEHKIYLREASLPAFDELCGTIGASHARGRGVAFHCVTRAELQFALAALREVGSRRGDRIEHASLADDAAIAQMRSLGVTVVTQPNFVFERGDRYLSEVAAEDQAVLYRGRAFLDAGVKLAAGTDAPFGDPDPWQAILGARARSTRAGRVLGGGEALSAGQALALFTGDPADPGRQRRLQAGAPADLCLLRGEWREVLAEPCRERVRLTLCDGQVIWAEQA